MTTATDMTAIYADTAPKFIEFLLQQKASILKEIERLQEQEEDTTGIQPEPAKPEEMSLPTVADAPEEAIFDPTS